MHLRQWGFARLAAHLWERAIGDEAAIRLDGAEALAAAREMRFRLAAQEIGEAAPAEEEEMIADFADGNDTGVTATLASVLDAEGFPVKAARVHAALVARDPKNFRSLTGLLVAAQKTPAAGFALDAVTSRLFAQDDAPPPPLQRELAMQAAQVLRRGGDPERAADILERAAAGRADDVALQAALADLRVAQGRLADAEKICRDLLSSQPGDTGAVLALGRVLEAREKTGDAIALYESHRLAETEDRLAALCARAGFASKALALAHRIVRVQPGRAPALAAEFDRNGRRSDALRLLQAASRISRDDAERFGLVERIVGLLGRDDARTGRHLARLRVLAEGSPELLARHFAAAAAHAADARGFLEGEWDNGKGPLEAGIQLAALLAKEGAKGAADGLVKVIVKRADPGMRDTVRLHAALAGRPGAEQAACAVSARIVALAPGNDAAFIARARDLRLAGRLDEAVATLDMLRLRTAFNPGLAPPLAQAYAECGRDAEAGGLCEEAMKTDPLARDSATWLAAADLFTRQGRLPEARRMLRGAYANETALNMAPLVRWVAAQHRLGDMDAEADAFQLTRVQRHALPRALFEHYAAENDAERALAVAADDVTVIFGAPDFPTRLREFAKAGRHHERAARIFEAALRQPGGQAGIIAGEAAALYADWAEHGLAAQPDAEALGHLERACELKPADLPLARRLVRLLADARETDRARAVLRRFLSKTENEREARDAREMLATLR
jgi:Tfp pilus assembly protein PilF